VKVCGEGISLFSRNTVLYADRGHFTKNDQTTTNTKCYALISSWKFLFYDRNFCSDWKTYNITYNVTNVHC